MPDDPQVSDEFIVDLGNESGDNDTVSKNWGDMTDEEYLKAVNESIELTGAIGHMGSRPQNWETARVLIAAPLSWDYVPAPLLDSMLALRKPAVWDWYRNRNAVGVATQRNAIVQHFLATRFTINGSETGFTHLFMVDADMTYPRESLQRLVELDKDIASGFACMREPIPDENIENTPVFRHTCGSPRGDNDFTFNYHRQFPAEDVAPFGVVSTGGVLIKRRVLEHMNAPWFDIVMWTKGADGKTRRVGEDVYFYSKARALGYEIWCDTSLVYGHVMMAKTIPMIDKYTRSYSSAVTLP